MEKNKLSCGSYFVIVPKTKQAKKFVELIETLLFAKILKGPNSASAKAIENARTGKAFKAKTLEQLRANASKFS